MNRRAKAPALICSLRVRTDARSKAVWAFRERVVGE